jgi:predicted dehydrogenase
MVVCCDKDPEKLARMRKLYSQVETTTELESILEDDSIDAVAIATPVHTHYRLSSACLRAGKHVLVEKPLAASSAECDALIEIAEQESRVLMVGHTFEYSVAVNRIRGIIESGELGQILYVSFTRLNLGLFQPDINVVWDLAPHDISILIYLLQKEPIAVNGQGKAHFKKGIEDVATATLHFDNGEIAFLHNSWLDPCKVRKTTIVGTNKMLVYDDVMTNEKIWIYDKGVEKPAHYETFADFHFAYRYGDIVIPRIEEQEPLRIECQHFLECIRENRMPRTDGRSGRRVVRILEAINESIRLRGALVSLEPQGEFRELNRIESIESRA